MSTLRENTIEAARAIRRYADGEILHETAMRIMDELIAVEPDPEIIETYQQDQASLCHLTTKQLHTLANDYLALADSPPKDQGPKPITMETARCLDDRDPYWTFPRSSLDDSPSRVMIVGGSWDGAKGTDSGRR